MSFLTLYASGYIPRRESIIKALETCQHKAEWVKNLPCMTQGWKLAARFLLPGEGVSWNNGNSGTEKKTSCAHSGTWSVWERDWVPKDVCDSQMNAVKILKLHRLRGKQGFVCGGVHIQTIKGSTTGIGLDTALRVSHTSTVEFLSSFTWNHNISSIQLFSLWSKSIKEITPNIWLIWIKNLTVQYQLTFLLFFFLFSFFFFSFFLYSFFFFFSFNNPF